MIKRSALHFVLTEQDMQNAIKKMHKEEEAAYKAGTKVDCRGVPTVWPE
jgi:hypothetical protein